MSSRYQWQQQASLSQASLDEHQADTHSQMLCWMRAGPKTQAPKRVLPTLNPGHSPLQGGEKGTVPPLGPCAGFAACHLPSPSSSCLLSATPYFFIASSLCFSFLPSLPSQPGCTPLHCLAGHNGHTTPLLACAMDPPLHQCVPRSGPQSAEDSDAAGIAGVDPQYHGAECWVWRSRAINFLTAMAVLCCCWSSGAALGALLVVQEKDL